MEVKLLEIRDRATFIPAMAIRLIVNESSNTLYEKELWLLRRAGYNREQITISQDVPYIILCKLDGVEAQYDPFQWGLSRTMRDAHRYIIDSWSFLKSGDLVDVEFINGETPHPKISERVSVEEY